MKVITEVSLLQTRNNSMNKTVAIRQQFLDSEASQKGQRTGSGLILQQSLNSNKMNSLKAAKTDLYADETNGQSTYQGKDNDVLSEDEQEDLAAQPLSDASSQQSINASEDEEECLSPLVKAMRESPDQLVLRPGSDDQQRNAISGASKRIKSEEEEQERRMELGGILVYDSYARISGSTKLTDYYEKNPLCKVNPYIIFTKEQVDQMTETYFNSQARERDFQSDIDKLYYQRFPKYDMKNKELKSPQYSLTVPQLHNMLIFDSRFESGNLRKAAKVNNIEYNLWLENDLNTKGHTQWFFFKVVFQSDKPAKIQFNIQNLGKTWSLFKTGMKPVVFSLKKYQQRHPDKITEGMDPLLFKDGWIRACDNIKYFQNDIVRQKIESQKFAQNMHNDRFLQNNNGHGEGTENYYTLSFDYRFEYPDDEVWFAHAVPYTYTEMQNSVKSYLDDESKKNFLQAEILCNTLCGMPVPLLTITENVQTFMPYHEVVGLQNEVPSLVRKVYKQKYTACKKLLQLINESDKAKVKKNLEQTFDEELQQLQDQVGHLLPKSFPQDFIAQLSQRIKEHSHKRCVVLTCRVHPGEPQASHMLEGTLNFLLGESPLAQELRKTFVFKVVPMLNPDGVIYGNYRCSLLGCDLNRKWLQPNKFLHPTIFYTKQLIRFTQWERKVVLYCDMHGHSRKRDVFFYGCCYKNFEQEGRVKNAQLRILPLLCCHRNQSFSFSGSSFRIEKQKESTGRVVVFREFNIMNSFTLECSFHGRTSGPDGKQTLHMSLQDMKDVGQVLIETLEFYLPNNIGKLQVIGSKVLDIFYDEFIKFVPAHKLKREKEEAVQQQNVQSEQNKEKKQDNQAINQLQQPNQNQKQVEFKKKDQAPVRKLQSNANMTLKNTLPLDEKSKRKLTLRQRGGGTVMRDDSPTGSVDDLLVPTTRQSDLQALPDFGFQDLELFMQNTYKKGVEKDQLGGASSSDEAELRDAKFLKNKKDDKLPNIRTRKIKEKKSFQSQKREKGYNNGTEINPLSNKAIIQVKHVEKVNQSAGQNNQRKIEQREHSINIQRTDINVGNGLQDKGQLGSAKTGTRIHPAIKTTNADSESKNTSQQPQIVEYVVDGKRIRVQRQRETKVDASPPTDKYLETEQTNADFNLMSPSFNESLNTQNNKLQGHGILKRLPQTDKNQGAIKVQPNGTVRGGIKSFTEYTDKLQQQKQLLKAKDSTFFGTENGSISPFKTQQHYQSRKPSDFMAQSHEQPGLLIQQTQAQQEADALRKEWEETPNAAKNKQRRSNLTHYPPGTDQHMKQKALNIVTHQQMSSNIDMLQQQIKSGQASMLNEQLIEAHKRLIQQDRESIMGIGFQIKMRPQNQDGKMGNILSVKSTQSSQKRELTQELPSVNNKNSSRSQDPSSKMYQEQQLHSLQLQFGVNGKPLTSLVCPIKAKVQTSALRTHLKHKRNVQVPLPLHQQERLAAQEQNQLQPAAQIAPQPPKEVVEAASTPQKEKSVKDVTSPRQKRSRVAREAEARQLLREQQEQQVQSGSILYVPKDTKSQVTYQLARGIQNPVTVNVNALQSATESASTKNPDAQQHNDIINGR